MNNQQTLDRLRNKPKKFLREHLVNSQWPESPDAGTQSLADGGLHLVEYIGGKRKQRPGRILGSWRKHTVREFTITKGTNMEAMLDQQDQFRHIGSIQGGLLTQQRSNSDTAPDFNIMGNPGFDDRRLAKGGQVFTADLNGCTIKRQQSSMYHVTPTVGGSGPTLHENLGPRQSTFGPLEYDTNKTHFAMIRKSTVKGRIQLLSQKTNVSGLPVMTKKWLR